MMAMMTMMIQNSDESDLGLHDARNDDQYEGTNSQQENGTVNGKAGPSKTKNPMKQAQTFNGSKKDLHRKQRGLLQWKPIRNADFAKNEAKFFIRRQLKKGSLS